MSHEEIMQRIITSTGISWDMTEASNTTLESLNPEKVMQYVKAVKKLGRIPIPEYTSDLDFLRKIDLVLKDKPSKAAILLFGNSPNATFPAAFLKAGRFRSPTLIVDDREFHGTLIEQLDGIMGWFREKLQTEFIIDGQPERIVKWEYPLKAIREAVVNTICHRDYLSAAHSQIQLFDDHLHIKNPGGLPPSLSSDMLLREHDSLPRNRKIAESFFYAGFIERWGSGTLRIADELHAANLPPPQFKSDLYNFSITLSTNKNITKSATAEVSNRTRVVLEYLKVNKRITNTEYQSITGVSKRTASRDLHTLVNKNVLRLEGSTGRGVIYKLIAEQ